MIIKELLGIYLDVSLGYSVEWMNEWTPLLCWEHVGICGFLSSKEDQEFDHQYGCSCDIYMPVL